MTIRLDAKDKKILALLDKDARLSNSQIAKKVGLSKPAVEYRLNRFEKNKVVFQYYTVVDSSKLGYSHYKLYLKFQNTGEKEEKEMIEHWVKNKNCVWVSQVRGRWDLAASFLAKTNFEFGKILSEFMETYAKYILEKDVLLTEYSPFYTREYLESEPTEFVYGAPQNHEIDEIEHKILKAISVNARQSVTELVKKTKLSRDVVNYRLKKLVADGIIVRYKVELNLPVIGIRLYKLVLRMKNFTKLNENKIKTFVRGNKKATQMLKLIGSWDLEIEFEVENEDELYKEINKLRKIFSDIIRDYDIIRVTELYKYNYYPF